MRVVTDTALLKRNRLAYRLRLVKEEHDQLVFTDQRYLRFIRFVLLVFTICPLFFSIFIYAKSGDIPLIVAFIPAIFSCIFLIVFIIKALSHKEVELEAVSKKIIVRKMRGAAVIKETIFPFGEVRLIEITVVKQDDRNYTTGNIRNYTLEILMQLSQDKEVHFAAVGGYDATIELGSKLSRFTGAGFKKD